MLKRTESEELKIYILFLLQVFEKSNDKKDNMGTWVDIFLSINPENQTDGV